MHATQDDDSTGRPVAHVVVLGNTNVDLVAYVPREVAEGETIIASDFTIGLGGKGANQAVAARRAGSAVSFIGRVGTDSFGEMMLEGLSQEGIDLAHLEQIDGPSGNATIWVQPDGANRITVFLGASGKITPEAAEHAVSTHSQAKFFVSQLELGHDVVLAGLGSAKSHGMTTVLNIAPYSALSPEMLEHTDWLIANEGELEALLTDVGIETTLELSPGELIEQVPAWSEAIGTNVVVTLGSQGALGHAAGSEPYFAEAPKVTAIDTVGAGDCFVGYFVSALNGGHPWQQALRSGVHAASESVQRLGAQASYPAAEDAKRFTTIS
ncbi:ribokinase [Pontimonas salivibrio]|uniref:Ribokinase n=1 Tax=Pontimonas salivibrio TaxID=1159327 RepID=A0A2L2BRC4_9MICO|nr:ribokinase [Pontimonas salivibrio]AVG24215.1 ribokinase [Pontimonas salivibrio]